jgi:putative ABC transport system permease protein
MVVQIDPRVDLATVAIAAGSVLASLAVFGLAPAIQVTRVPLRPQLATDGGPTGHLRWRARRRLIALQVAISLSFTLIAAFAVRVAIGERLRSSGIDVDRLAIGVLNFRLPPWNQARALEAIDRLSSMAASQSGVDAVAVSSGLPFGTNYTPQAELALPGQASAANNDAFRFAPFVASTPSIFRTLGVGIVRGRPFEARDNAGAPPVIVLSELTARQVFGSTDIVGRQVLLKSGLNMSDHGAINTLTVIGIAADTDTQRRYSRDAGAVYVPLAQHYEPLLAIIGRTADDPSAILAPLKALASRADPDLVVDRLAPAAMMVTGAYVLIGVVSRGAGGLALLALVLAMAGLFGVLSHLVARRTREMGLRMALGADPKRIRRLIIGDGLRPVLAGIAVGWAVGLLVRFLLRAAYAAPLSVNDLLVFAVAPLPIVAAAVLASYWPARRASRVDPNVALREL